MFLPCPNCGFLVALIPLRGNASQRCPRCGTALPRPDEIAETPPLVPAAQRPEPEGAAEADDDDARRAGSGALEAPADAAGGFALQVAPAHADDRQEAAGSGAADAAPPEGGPADPLPQPPADAPSPEPSGDAPMPTSTAGRDAGPEPTAPEPHDADADAAATGLADGVEAAPTPSAAPLAFPLHDDAAAQAAADATARLAATPRRTSPSFARRTRLRRAGRRGPLLAGIAVLALVLALQLLLAQRAELAADARWRPWVQATCGVLGCDVPAWHQPAAFAMVERSVQPRPGAPGVLAVRARFRNGAPWAQEWPVVVLTLSDVNGGVLGARALRPAEYAPGARPATLAPGAEGSLAVDVAEPAPGVVAFGFDFR